MNAHEAGRDARRGRRRAVGTLVPVVNAMTQRVIGLTRDLSAGGLQLQAPAPLVDDALYQLQVELQSAGNRPVRVEAGAQVVRQDRRSDGGTLVGMRFIHLDATNKARLAAWLDSPLGH